MMQPIKLSWQGAEYTIPASRAFKVGAAVEKHVKLGQIATWGDNVPFYDLATIYAEMLNFAGVKVTEEDVFADIMQSVKSGDNLAAVSAVSAVVACLMGGAPPAAAGEGDGAKT